MRLDAVIVSAGRLLASPDIGFRSPVTGRPVYGRHRRRGSNPFEVCGVAPQTAVIFVVTRRYSSGLLNFAAHSLEDSQRDRKCRSARLEQTVPKGLFRYRTADLARRLRPAIVTLRDYRSRM